MTPTLSPLQFIVFVIEDFSEAVAFLNDSPFDLEPEFYDGLDYVVVAQDNFEILLVAVVNVLQEVRFISTSSFEELTKAQQDSVEALVSHTIDPDFVFSLPDTSA